MINTIWSEATIQRFADEGELRLFESVSCIVDRYALAVTLGEGNYVLPSYIQNIRQVTWKGYVLDPLREKEYEIYSYSGTSTIPQGKPREYVYSNIGAQRIRFYPVPNESISGITTNLYGTEIANRVIIEFYRYPDTTGTTYRLPTFVIRRMVKDYVLWHCYKQEGKGQNLVASNYYQSKWNNNIQRFQRVYGRLFSAKSTVLGGNGPPRNRKLHRPVLPQNYPRSF